MIGKIKKKQATKIKSTVDPSKAVDTVITKVQETVSNVITSSTDSFVTKAEDMIGKIKRKQATKIKSTVDPSKAVDTVITKVQETVSNAITSSTDSFVTKAEDMIGKRKKQE